MNNRFHILSAVLVSCASLTARAEIITIPDESGISGFVSGGVQYVELSSNTVAGNRLDDLYNTTITSLGSPAREDAVGGSINFDLRYTLAESGTQFFLGNLLQDALRYDFSTQLGVRQEFGDKGIVSLSYLFSTFPAEVYVDPFLTGTPREKTDQDSTGIRVGWSDIWGSRFSFSFDAREHDLDREQSGQSVATLTQAERASLNRNGDVNTYRFLYNWHPTAERKHLLTPSIMIREYDLDGDSVSRDETLFQLTYTYNHDRFTVVSNAGFGQLDYDRGNPVFAGAKADSDELGLTVAVFRHRLGDVEKLSGYVSAAYFESDSDIDFYDQEYTSIGAGLLYRF